MERLRWLKEHTFKFIRFWHDRHGRDYVRTRLENDTHVLHITKGSGTITIENHEYPLQRGNIFSVPPNTINQINAKADLEMLTFHCHIILSDGKLMETKARLPYFFQVDYFDECEEILIKVSNFMDHKSSRLYPDLFYPAPFIYQVMLRHIVSVDLIDCESPEGHFALKNAIKLLRSSECRNFDLSKLAKMSALSVSQFSRSFKKLFYITPQKYWENYRFAHICIALEKSRKNLSELALDFGFADSACFAKWFKKHANKTPSEWRKDIIQRQQD